jgi:hypothetical protein
LVVSNPHLRRAAEESRLPLSKSFFHLLLLATLVEEEGIMGMVLKDHRYEFFAKIMCSCFKTESNARIARPATAKETWLEKLCVAWELYRILDIGDRDYGTLMWGAFKLIGLIKGNSLNIKDVVNDFMVGGETFKVRDVGKYWVLEGPWWVGRRKTGRTSGSNGNSLGLVQKI